MAAMHSQAETLRRLRQTQRYGVYIERMVKGYRDTTWGVWLCDRERS